MWIRLILPLFLLLQPVYSSKTHVCARCVDEGAKVVESRWHSASYMRLLYNDSWPTCSKRNNVTSSIGCFRVRMSKGMVPHGAVYEMQGPMSSLLTVNGYDLREYTIQGNETVLMLDKTQFEFYFCQSATCFLDVVMPPDPHLLPYSQKRLPSLPTTSTTFPLIPVTEPKAALVVAAKPAPSLPSAFQALMNPWVIAFMFVVAFVSGSLALLLAFALALRWEKKVLAKRASLPLWQIGYPRIERSPVSSTDGTIGEYSDSSSNSSTNSKMFEMKMMFVVFFMNSLLSLAVAVHYCVQCIDPEAREAERVNHNERTIRLLYNHDWASCSTEEGRKTVVTSENGCFRARIYQGKVPKGYYYLAMGPISSLLTVRGEDLRWHKEEGKIFSRGYDKTLFEIEPCYRERCFEEHLVYWADRPIPATTPNVSSVPTTALVTEVQTTNSCGICFFLLVAGVISLITFVFVFIGGLFLARHLARRLGRRLEIGQKHVPQETNPFTGPALCPLLEGTTIV